MHTSAQRGPFAGSRAEGGGRSPCLSPLRSRNADSTNKAIRRQRGCLARSSRALARSCSGCTVGAARKQSPLPSKEPCEPPWKRGPPGLQHGAALGLLLVHSQPSTKRQDRTGVPLSASCAWRAESYGQREEEAACIKGGGGKRPFCCWRDLPVSSQVLMMSSWLPFACLLIRWPFPSSQKSDDALCGCFWRSSLLVPGFPCELWGGGEREGSVQDCWLDMAKDTGIPSVGSLAANPEHH